LCHNRQHYRFFFCQTEAKEKVQLEVEELFILTGPHRERLLEEMRDELHVMVTSGYVALVKGESDIIKQFAALEGVCTGSDLIHAGKGVPEGEWTLSEEMAIRGWLRGQSPEYQNEKKSRRGDGLSWSAPGFKPPGRMGP
jgi:hypothetical protein